MKRHVITCQARTGSTMLRHLINDHAQCVNHGEIFKLWRTLHFFQHIKVVKDFGFSSEVVKKVFKSDEADFFEKFVFHSQEGVRSVGFKFKTDEFYNPYFKSLSNYILANKDIQIVHLRRKDLFKQYISKLTVLNNTMPKFYMKSDENLNLKDFVVDVNHFESFVTHSVSEDDVTVSNFKEHDVLHLWYEDVVGQSSSVSKDLFEFLGVDYQHVDFRTKKIIFDHRELVKNIDELYQYASKSKHQDRLECLTSINTYDQ